MANSPRRGRHCRLDHAWSDRQENASAPSEELSIMIPLLPAAALGLIGAGWYKARQAKQGELTPTRRKIYHAAMSKLEDPAKLKELAGEFDKAGLRSYGEMLRKRANLRALPADVKAIRRKVFKEMLVSKDKDAVLRVAQAYENEGAWGNAQALRTYANSLG